MSARILMIDDDTALTGMLGERLAAAGLELAARATAASGEQALRQGDFELLILDVMLPDGDGLELCRRIRAGSDIPILMLTARGDEVDRIVGLELGADDYLPKPFHPRELIARLRALLRRSRATPEAADRLRFGALEIDRGAREVRNAGRRCELTAHQFALLLALAENAGRVQSREQLMEHVRGDSLEAFDRSIDVHVSRIRAAIEADPKKPRRILTVRGAGYVFSRLPEDDDAT